MAARESRPHLLDSKLAPPTQARALLLRQPLIAGLEQMASRRLVLLSAPAGYGKTTLLTQWFEALRAQGRRAAWLGIDAGDNDFMRLAAHCLGALSTVGIVSTMRRGSPLAPGAGMHGGMESGPSDEAMVAELASVFEQIPHETWLFMDDVHLLTSSAAHRLLNSLLHAHSSRVHLVIASRDRPLWALARLRALDEMHEIDAAQLTFSATESAQIIAEACGKTLSDAQLATLHARTEGWPASVRLVAIALREVGDVDGFIDRFSGVDRTVADFLVEEVLAQQAPELQEFLLATSILRRFNSELANELLGIANASKLIERLQTLNLFLFSLDRERQWYRYHHLFADLLRQRVADQQPDRLPMLHRRAGAWLAAHGLPIEAVEHALAAGDIERAGRWLDEASPGLFASGQTATLQAFASRLPPRILATLPRLQLELVWEDTIRWRFDRVRAVLPVLASQLSSITSSAVEPDAGVDDESLHSRMAHRTLMLEVFTDRLASAELAAQAWPPRGCPVDAFEDASIATAMVMCRRERYDCELAHAHWSALHHRFAEAGATYGTVFLDTVVGGTLFMRGELVDAESAFVRGRGTAIGIQGADSALAMMPSVQLAAVNYEMNRIVEAGELLKNADALAPDFGLVDSAIAHRITSARMARAVVDYRGAHRSLDAATFTADRFALPRLHAHVLAERVRLLIDEGLVRDAAQLVGSVRYAGEAGERKHIASFDSTQERLAAARVRVDIELGELSQAQRVLRHWLAWLGQREARLPRVGLLTLLAKAQLRAGERAAAQRTLVDAVKLASQGGIVRTLVDEGPEIGALIGEFAPLIRDTGLVSGAYLSALLAARGAVQDAPVTIAPEPSSIGEANFSGRELDILRLAAANLSSAETARALGLAEGTVKWYWQGIFEKTGVRRKSMAVRIARERGSID